MVGLSNHERTEDARIIRTGDAAIERTEDAGIERTGACSHARPRALGFVLSLLIRRSRRRGLLC